MTESDPALLSSFGEVRFLAQKGGKISIDGRHLLDPGQIRRRFEPGEDCIGDLASRNFFFAVTARNIARPKTDIFAVGMIHRSEKDDRMTVFAPTDILVPKNFHEIARLRLREIRKVSSESEFVKQAASSGAVGVPAAPNPFAIALVANHKLVQRCKIELELAAVAQGFDRFDEDDISRARAETRIRRGRDDEEFSRFEVRGRFQLNFGEVRDGVIAAARHLLDLLEN